MPGRCMSSEGILRTCICVATESFGLRYGFANKADKEAWLVCGLISIVLEYIVDRHRGE